MEICQAQVSGPVHERVQFRAGSRMPRRRFFHRAVLGLALFPGMLLGCGAGGAADPTAASASKSTAAPTANLLFKSNFGSGVSLGAPYGFSSRGAYQDLTGTDSETGYTWPVAALGANFSGVQLIAPVPITSSTIGHYTRAELRTVSGPKGTPVSELFLNTVDNGGVGNTTSAQTDFLIRRSWTSGDITNLYTTYWVKFQADLAAGLDPAVSSGNWKAVTEFKTGGYNNTGGGDYRISVNVMKNVAGELYWLVRGDNNANRETVDSSGAVVTCPNAIYCPFAEYWRIENHTVPVPIDTWAKVEVYWHRSGGADGRYWVAVNGHVIADHLGPNMGDFGLPVTRIFSTLAYSGGQSPNETHSTGLEFWDGFPCGVGVSCY